MAADAPHPAFEEYAAEAPPSAPVGAPGKDGVLELGFRREGDATVLAHDYATAPFHVSGTLGHDPHPAAETVCLQSPTGGLAQGDRLDATIEAGADTVAHVTDQSATKVQSMTHNYAASDTSLDVGPGGHLEYVPEPTILHADARYHQTITLDVAADAIAVVGDVVVPGRLARGERFDFERCVSRVTASGPDGLLFEDATHLAPGSSDPGSPGVLGEFSVYGSLFVVAPAEDADALSDRLHASVADETARSAATALPNGAGVVVRALADRADHATGALYAAWTAARETLADAPAPARRAV
jgi:urease accessory protein